MDVLVVGSVALDDVKTPQGEELGALGGSAVYASLAASYFSRPGIVGVVGKDFPARHTQLLAEHNILLDGLACSEGQTFHWAGYYEHDMNTAFTTATHLNVFADFSPVIPPAFQAAPFVFLGNIDPSLQAKVLDQVGKPAFTLLDTMNYWISNKRRELMAVLPRVDMVVVNDAEARQLSGHTNLLQAAQWVRQQGPKGVIIKKGEHGALIFWENQVGIVPAFLLEQVVDPTGAGDTFAGGFIGALAQHGKVSADAVRAAAVVGVIMASFTVEDFSVRRLAGLKAQDIRDRHAELRRLTAIEALATDFKLK